MNAHTPLRHHLSIQRSLEAERSPSVADSIERIVGAMSAKDTLDLIVRLVDHDKFADFDVRTMRLLDNGLEAALRFADDDEHEAPTPRLFPEMHKLLRDQADMGVVL